MLAKSNIVGFVTTAKPEQSKIFFEKTLGLDFDYEDDFAIVFKSNGLMLRVAKTKEFTPQPFTVLGWDVKGVRAIAKSLKEKGVRFERYEGMGQDELNLWHAPSGAIIGWFKDPDGNLLSITEFKAK